MYRVLNMNYYQLSEPAACKAALAEYKEYNDSVRQFLKEMLDQCVWDVLPYQFLYDLYKAWFDRNMPSGTKQNKTAFIDNLTSIIEADPNLPWGATGRSNAIRPGNRMNAPEPLIIAYQLNDWKNPIYRGNDPDQICHPLIKATYRGLYRTGPGSTVLTDKKEDDED